MSDNPINNWKPNEHQLKFLNIPIGTPVYLVGGCGRITLMPRTDILFVNNGEVVGKITDVNMPKYPLTDQDEQELTKRFTYHSPKDDQPSRYAELRKSALTHARLIMECVPAGRERAVALTQLEDSTMWANAGIARNE